MKALILKFTIILCLIATCNLTFSQNIKKAFKELHDKKNYNYAWDVFTSDEYEHKAYGKFGRALVYYHKPYEYNEDLTPEGNKHEEIKQKVNALREARWARIENKSIYKNKKETEKLKEYFSNQKIKELQKEIETKLLQYGFEDLKPFTNDLLVNSDNDEFRSIIKTKWIEHEFEIVKTKAKTEDKLSSAKKLVKKYPNQEKIKPVKRYIDSLKVSEANTIYSISSLLSREPDNQFKSDAVNKLKKINKIYREKLFIKNPEIKKILVCQEYLSEEEAINGLTDYYNYTAKQYRKDAYYYYYLELSESEMKKFNSKNKYLLYKRIYDDENDWVLRIINTNKKYFNNCYCLDFDNGLQIYSKDKVYKKGKPLNSYNTIVFLFTGKYKKSYDAVNRSMQEVIEKLKLRTKLQIITDWNITYYTFKVFPDDNPFPTKIKILDFIPEFDSSVDNIHVIFLKNNKKTYPFTIDPGKTDEAFDRIMKKVDFYFK